MKASRRLFLGVSIAAMALVLPSGAMAEDSEVSGVGGTELSLAVTTPAAMTLLYSTPPTATSVATVTSTSLNWTLSISDQDGSGSGTPGRMDAVDCVTRALLGGSLANPLQWSANGGGTYTDLSGTPATVGTGSLVGVHTVTYRQGLDSATDEVAAGDCYGLTATYTVTDS